MTRVLYDLSLVVCALAALSCARLPARGAPEEGHVAHSPNKAYVSEDRNVWAGDGARLRLLPGHAQLETSFWTVTMPWPPAADDSGRFLTAGTLEGAKPYKDSQPELVDVRGVLDGDSLHIRVRELSFDLTRGWNVWLTRVK